MGERPGILFRFELLDALEQLAPADVGNLFLSVMRYGKDGVLPEFKNPVLSVLWPFLKSAADRDAESYDSKTAQRRYALYCREMKRKEETPLSFDDWKISVDIEVNRPILPGVHAQPQLQPQNHTQEQEQMQEQRTADKPPAPARRKFGAYGWVKLTDDEHNRLERDLGADELARCISYIDEAAQGNGNKNKWKDWNLVIRRCSREGWGRNRSQQNDRNKLRTDADYQGGDFFDGGDT